MRTRICFLIFQLLIIFSAVGQNTFVKTYQAENNSWGPHVLKVDSGFLLCGNSGNKIYLVRTDQNGDTLWTKKYGNIATININHVAINETSDVGYILTCNLDTGALLMKLDHQCDVLWTRKLVSTYFFPWDIRQTTDGGYIVTGSCTAIAAGMEICLVKTDSTGNISWAKRYGSPDTDEGLMVKQVWDGGYIILCSTTLFGSNSNRGLIRTDVNGNVVWSKGYGFVGGPEVRTLELTEDSNIVFINGCCSGFSIDKIDTLGSILWSKYYARIGPNQGMGGKCIKQTSDGGFIISGTTSQNLLLKLDTNGDTVWVKRYQGQYYGEGYQVEETVDNGYIVAISFEDTINFDIKEGLMKTDGDGMVGCYDDPFPLQITDTLNFGSVDYNFNAMSVTFNSLSASINLSSGSELNIQCNGLAGIQNSNYIAERVEIFPNPTSDFVTITNASGSELVLFDTMGEKIMIRTMKVDEVTINCENLPSGIYFVQVQTENGMVVKKLIKQ